MASTAFVGVDLGAGGAPRAPAHVVEPFLGARDASDGSNGGVAALGGGSAAREAALLVELELARLGDSAAGVRDAFNGYRDARDAEGGEVASLARARAAALAEARDALGRKTATILEAVRRKCKDHRRDRDRILAESAASVAAATREALAEHDKFDGLQALALGAIESAQARAEASCQALRNENAALREELQSVVRRGVSDLANSGSRSDLACAAAAGPFRKPGQVTSSESSRGGGSGSDSDPRAAGSSEAETSDPSDDGASNSAGSGGDICKGVVEGRSSRRPRTARAATTTSPRGSWRPRSASATSCTTSWSSARRCWSARRRRRRRRRR